MSAIDELENVKWLQSEWSDNAVSCTVYYRKEELPAIRDWLVENYNTSVKSVSFLLHSDHGFAQAPYEEITEEEYTALMAKCTPITGYKACKTYDIENNSGLVDSSAECRGGMCPLR